MMNNAYNSDFKKILAIGLFALLIIFIIFYGYFKLRHIIVGPHLSEISIENTHRTDNDYLSVTGKAKNIVEIKMNGKQIFTTEDGGFNEDIMLGVGYNIVVFELIDHMGKSKTYEFPIILDKQELIDKRTEDPQYDQENNQEENT